MVMLFIVSALTGCPVADRHANLFASHWRAHAGLTSSPQIGVRLRAVMRAPAVRVLSVRVAFCALS